MLGNNKLKIRINLIVVVTFCFSLVLLSGIVKAEKAPTTKDPLEVINDDYKSGAITIDEKVILQITAIKDSKKLPSKYRLSESPDERAVFKSATLAIRDIILNWDQLQTSTQEIYNQMIVRPTTSYTYDSPGGFFKFHYEITGDDAVPADDDNSNGIPDFVEKCAAYCDSSLDKSLALGYYTPPSDNGSGGDEKYDIYFDNFGYYGMCVSESPGPEEWNDYSSYIYLHNNFLGFPSNDDPEGQWQGAAKVTTAHEFHHAVQYAYDVSEDNWFMELDAVYMEDITYDQVNDCYNYLGSFFNEPEKSLMDNSFHQYSCFIWNLYLAQKFDTSLMVAVWEGARYSDVFDALSDTLLGRYGWSQDSAFAEFVTWNYITGERDDGLHHAEASEYPLIAISRTHNYYPVALQNSAKSPTGYASCYVEFIPPGVPGTVLFKFDGADTRQWAAYLIKSLSVDQHIIEKIDLNPVTYEGEIEVKNFETYHRVALIGANLSEFTSGANFSYEAEQVSLRSVASEVLTDSAVYSGGTREFEYRVINTAEDNDIFDIIVWDEKGWITPDTISRPMAAGLDTVFYIPVSSPQQTPLGETSTLYFMARSWGDPDIYDSVAHQAEAVLYRGDANFSGSINISDITYLVGYLFGSGPPPQPVSLAGDYNCSETVNISDITNIVYYLFDSGAKSPCNPY